MHKSGLHSQLYVKQHPFVPLGIAIQVSPTEHLGLVTGGHSVLAHILSILSGTHAYAGQQTLSSVTVAKCCNVKQKHLKFNCNFTDTKIMPFGWVVR